MDDEGEGADEVVGEGVGEGADGVEVVVDGTNQMTVDISLSGLNIQLRLQAPYDIVLTTALTPGELSAESVGRVMDLLTEVAEREKLKGELASHQSLLRRNKEMLANGMFERNIAALRAQRAKLDGDITKKWVSSERRGEPKMSGSQKTAMDDFETKIALELKAKRDVENGIHLIAWQIDCLFARIAGQAEPPMPDEVAAVMPQIELPEDVGFTAPIAA